METARLTGRSSWGFVCSEWVPGLRGGSENWKESVGVMALGDTVLVCLGGRRIGRLRVIEMIQSTP